jgi:hypothetical protein
VGERDEKKLARLVALIVGEHVQEVVARHESSPEPGTRGIPHVPAVGRECGLRRDEIPSTDSITNGQAAIGTPQRIFGKCRECIQVVQGVGELGPRAKQPGGLRLGQKLLERALELIAFERILELHGRTVVVAVP